MQKFHKQKNMLDKKTYEYIACFPSFCSVFPSYFQFLVFKLSSSFMKSYEMDLTAGNLAPKLLRFSIPLVLTNIMQVLFNMTDLAVVGRFSGPDALGAVGSVPNFLFIFTGLVIGLGSGVNSICAFFDYEISALSRKTCFLVMK